MPELSVVHHPHPILRYRAKPIVRVDKELKEIVAEMFRLMYHHRGVGLAATQVALPVRLFVCNPSGDKAQGPEMVFINPVVSRPKGIDEAEEGCLSLPGINANVKRNKAIWVNAFDLSGREIDAEFSGYLARIIQHECDHLDGVLFVDRLSEERRRALEEALAALEEDFHSRQRTGSLVANEDLMRSVPSWEDRYC